MIHPTRTKMSLAFQAISTNKNPTPSLAPLFPTTQFRKTLNSPFSRSSSATNFPISTFFTSQNHMFPLRRLNASFDEFYGTSPSQSASSITTLEGFNVDALLSIIEFLSLASSVAISLSAALCYGVSKGDIKGLLGSKIIMWQCVFLVTSMLVGAMIRRRQWRRVCGAGISEGSVSYGANLLGRVEKVEEDLRSSATLIRVLSRQLEKLGLRVRATRKALKEPISETAALAQKNSEATRALAAQEDILENELGEIQKVLLAMQEQQQKQLELILAIGKARNLWDTKHEQTSDDNASQTLKSVDGESNLGIKQNETLGAVKVNQH